MRTPFTLAAVVVTALLPVQQTARAAFQGPGGTSASVDAAFSQFWDARSPVEAEAAAAALIKSGVSVDEALTRLKRGRPYAQAARGVIQLSHQMGKDTFGYALDVPQNYDPSRRYQVRVQLHGGVSGRADGTVRGSGAIGSLAGAEQIYVLPASWNDAPWWGDKQMESVRVILDNLKRSHNVDENRVVVSGVSDGGTAAYFVAMRETTPFASFLPLNGALLVLTNASLAIRGDLLTNNLRNKPFFVVNGGQDPLYPPAMVEPYVDHLQQNGVDLTYRPQPDGVHNTAWWPQVRDSFEQFVSAHPRIPHPPTLTWETDARATAQRAHWLVIDELDPTDQRPALSDLNRFVPAPLASFGLRAQGNRVTSIQDSSSASTFNFKPDDLVVAVNDKPVPAGQPILQFLEAFPANALMTVTVVRGAERIELRGYFVPGVSTPRRVFARTAPVGRVDLVREGNTITAATRGVSAFTLLLSPDVIDFTKPVKVVADDRTVFDGPVTRSLETLIKWAARDNDRTMLYAAEITVKLVK